MTDVERTREEIDANVANLQAQAAKAQAEARKATAEAMSEEAVTQVRSVQAARALRLEKAELAKDDHHHLYIFDMPVMTSSLEGIYSLPEESKEGKKK
jgi:hypothetical protein